MTLNGPLSASPSRAPAFAILTYGVLALLVFVLSGWNHLISIYLSSGDYSPFSVGASVSALVFDETHLYSIGPSRFMHHGLLHGDLDVWEMQRLYSPYPVLSHVLLGALGRVLGGLESAWILSHCLMPTLAWGLVVAACRTAQIDLWLSAASGYIFILFPWAPRNALLLGYLSTYQPLEITRMPNPSLSVVLLLLSMILAASALSRETWKASLLPGGTAGLLFYTYYFFWVPVVAALALVALVQVLRARRRRAQLAALMVACALLVGAPYVVMTLLARAAITTTLMPRLGAFTHSPSLFGAFLLALFGLAMWWHSGKVLSSADHVDFRDWLEQLILATLAGCGVAYNLQTLSGYDPMNGAHYMNRVIQPLLTLGALILVSRLPQQTLRKGILLFSVGLVMSAFYRQTVVARNTWHDHQRSGPEMDVLLKTRALVTKGVIGTSDARLIAMLPGVTGDWSFVPSGYRTAASDDEIIRRYMAIAKLEGKTFEEAVGTFREPPLDEYRAWSAAYIVFFGAQGSEESLRRDWESLDWRTFLSGRALEWMIVPAGSSLSYLREEFPDSRERYRNGRYRILELAPIRGQEQTAAPN